MAIRITTTHVWTKLFIPINWVSRLLCIGLVLSLLDLMGADGTFGVILFIVGFFGALIVHGLFIEQFYHVIQTYLYVTVNLGTKISMRDARYLMFLFAPSELGQWYPMKGIKDLPKEIRRQALMESTKRIYREIGHFPPEPDVETNQTSYSSTSTTHGSDMVMDGFSDLVSMLCKLAKADNHISKEEIELIESFFKQTLNLTPDQRKQAVNYFNEAKVSDIPFEAYARRFLQYHRQNQDLLEAICTLLTNLALADGELSSEEEILINQTISIFDVPGRAYNEFKKTYRQHPYDSASGKEKKYAKVLGLDKNLSHEIIRQAYRRLAMQYHPDKVAHLGAKMKEVAEHEMKLINEAYEYLRSRYAKESQPAYD